MKQTSIIAFRNRDFPRKSRIVLLLLICAVSASACAKTQDSVPGTIARIYFLNASANTIEPEERAVSGENDGEIAASVFDAFMEGPKNKSLTRTFPDNLLLRDKITISASNDDDADKTMVVDFSREYYDMTPVQELFFRASFVWTMTSLPFIGNVQVYVDGRKLTDSRGRPIDLISKDDFVLNPSISATKIEPKSLTLYFASENGELLTRETRDIEVNPETELAKYVVNALIAGPKYEWNHPVLPPDIKLEDVRTEEGVCYVSLSADFLSKFPGGACLPATTVWAIVNSLTELPDVDKIKFLVDSESVGMYRGAVDLSKAVERDEHLIFGQ